MAKKRKTIKKSLPTLFPSFVETDTFSFESELLNRGYRFIAGTDEVGRGPLAGPVVAASVVLPADCEYQIYDDSKKLSAAKREELFAELKRVKAEIGISIVSEETIDRINILQASLVAMRDSIISLSLKPDFILVDGKFPVPIDISQQPLVKGDSRSASIAAASIVAKVTRDSLMDKFHEEYPQYGFRRNKGYPTLEHREAIKKYGICPIHRKSFSSVKEYI